MGKTAEGQDGGNPQSIFPAALGKVANPDSPGGSVTKGALGAVCDDDGSLPASTGLHPAAFVLGPVPD